MNDTLSPPKEAIAPGTIELSYDYNRGRLTAVNEHGDSTAPSLVVLTEAVLIVRVGTRSGCGDTGLLGYVGGVKAEGVVSFDLSVPQCSLRFDGYKWRNRDNNKEVTGCTGIVASGSTMTAFNPVYA